MVRRNVRPNAAVHETSDADDNSALVPVGRPIDNVKLYVLDARLKRVPVGASGELCIAGRCLSAGYWQDQDRTDRCFVPNPYDGGQYNVLYRSGTSHASQPAVFLRFAADRTTRSR